MKEQLLVALSLLHEKVAALKMYDLENAGLLRQYGEEYEALLTKLLQFDQEKFSYLSTSYLDIIGQDGGYINVHDDTENSGGFYNSVENLNISINNAIEILNGI